MVKYEIRKANTNDLAKILELNNKLFEYEQKNYDPVLMVGWPYTEKGTSYFTDMLNNQVVFLAISGDEVVGYLAGSFYSKPSYVTKPFAEIDNMYILEAFQKLKIGTKLITAFKKYCFEREVFEIKVTANAKNKNAISFYLKNGFEDYEITFKFIK